MSNAIAKHSAENTHRKLLQGRNMSLYFVTTFDLQALIAELQSAVGKPWNKSVVFSSWSPSLTDVRCQVLVTD